MRSANEGPFLLSDDGKRYQGIKNPDGSESIGFSKSLSSPTYNTDGTLASATINGIAYTFSYSAGKIATVNYGGITETYTWSGDQLQSVVVA